MDARSRSSVKVDADHVKDLQDALLARTVARFRLGEVDAEVRALRERGDLVPVRLEAERHDEADGLARAERRVLALLAAIAQRNSAFPV